MSELVEFLLARIAEDEAAAREYHDMLAAREREMAVAGAAPGIALFAFSAPGGPGDPARVLLECEAKRRIVERAATIDSLGGHVGDYTHGARGAAQLACRELAAVYADHKDFRDEWC